EDRVAVVGVLEPGHDLEERRLARAVGSDDADLAAVQERQRDVVEDHLVAVRLPHVAQGEDVVSHVQNPTGRTPGTPDRGVLSAGRQAACTVASSVVAAASGSAVTWSGEAAGLRRSKL